MINAFTPVTSDPGPIDVYGDAFVDDDWTPLASAPYGTMSEFFDPTAMDEEGNGLLRFYPAGPKGSDDRPMSQSFTLGAGDTYTVFVMTSARRMAVLAGTAISGRSWSLWSHSGRP